MMWMPLNYQQKVEVFAQADYGESKTLSLAGKPKCISRLEASFKEGRESLEILGRHKTGLKFKKKKP